MTYLTIFGYNTISAQVCNMMRDVNVRSSAKYQMYFKLKGMLFNPGHEKCMNEEILFSQWPLNRLSIYEGTCKQLC